MAMRTWRDEVGERQVVGLKIGRTAEARVTGTVAA